MSSGPSSPAPNAALLALVRLLARAAAREWLSKDDLAPVTTQSVDLDSDPPDQRKRAQP